jgi:hypothetical protein
VSKSELRRLEIVAPEAIKELREQIAREIEASMMFHNGEPIERDRRDLSMLKYAAAIARGEK